MEKILLLATGGTIASREMENGLAPALGSEDLVGWLKGYGERYSFESETIFDMDSSNIQPEQWRQIAKRVYEVLPRYKGIIITHGTDTMAYTASSLSYMLQNLHKSVVLTGSQLPMEPVSYTI